MDIDFLGRRKKDFERIKKLSRNLEGKSYTVFKVSKW